MFGFYNNKLEYPAETEEEWQDRRRLLPDDADQLAGDKYSKKRFLALRAVINENGEEMKFRIVDEYGRSYVD